MSDVAVIILTFNEEIHIARAIGSVDAIAKQIFVVDSGSTDATVRIAEACGAVVLRHEFVNQAEQLQWALDNAPISADWTLRLDADEEIEPRLREEVAAKLPLLGADVVGVVLKYKLIFMGKWIKHGGRFPLKLLRLWRTGHATVQMRWMDEYVAVEGGKVVSFDGCFADHNLKDLSFFTEKHNRYAVREAIEILNRRIRLFGQDERSGAIASRQTSTKRWIKANIYYRLPFALSSALYFLWRYVVLLGFLDGRSGLVYHFLQGYWYRFLVGAKVMELERAIAHLTDKREIAAELSRLTGHQLVVEHSAGVSGAAVERSAIPSA